VVQRRTWKQASSDKRLSYRGSLGADSWANSWSRWPQMPLNSFDTTTHSFGPQHRSKFPGCFPPPDLVRDMDVLLDLSLCALYFLAVVMFVAYIQNFLWAEVRRVRASPPGSDKPCPLLCDQGRFKFGIQLSLTCARCSLFLVRFERGVFASVPCCWVRRTLA